MTIQQLNEFVYTKTLTNPPPPSREQHASKSDAIVCLQDFLHVFFNFSPHKIYLLILWTDTL